MPFPLLATTPISSPLSPKNPLHRQPTKSPNNTYSLRLPNTISCEQKQVNNDGSSHQGIDRRNVLLGLGGLYGAATTTMAGGKVANADGGPVQPPDLSMCILATDSQADDEPVNCCPPNYSMSDIIDFELPPSYEPVNQRKPAHKLSPREIKRYKAAIAKMKQLNPKDPWNFMQQATIHCTFCNGAFFQVNYPDKLLQVHGNWLFLPWHRYYLYFWERILGKIIGDPTLAIPYWNWDTADGMFMPSVYLDDESSLYNDKRNHEHYKALMDFNYKNEPTPTPNPRPDEYRKVINRNYEMVEALFTKDQLAKASLFMGQPIVAGEEMSSKEMTENAGAIETLHNLAHEWVGPVAKPNHDMGNFYTAARDTLFFAHHANVDRMWDIYSKKRGYKVEFNDPDFLEASFLFYDENRQLVRCKVSDSLSAEQLGYTYAPEVCPWEGIGRRIRKEKTAKKQEAKKQLQLVEVSEFGTQPRPLDDPIRALVRRPKKNRSKLEMEEEIEVLVVDNIQFEPGTNIRFDVYISKPIEGLATPDYGEYAGRFSRIPHIHNKKFHHTGKARLQIGITELVENINAESSKGLVVTLVPRMGYPSIGGVFIELQEVDY
ncbi:hypothetical protein Syun_008344 [Stephania yunnanensis]|uniref:Tyrosinase copper-binding domain-containing protein n=1 Tax=Stephania yunnanensis TaxID=152371 RepID=A0AAP0KDK4_9MAGN